MRKISCEVRRGRDPYMQRDALEERERYEASRSSLSFFDWLQLNEPCHRYRGYRCTRRGRSRTGRPFVGEQPTYARTSAAARSPLRTSLRSRLSEVLEREDGQLPEEPVEPHRLPKHFPLMVLCYDCFYSRKRSYTAGLRRSSSSENSERHGM